MSKESFKTYARKHPSLSKSVVGGKISWQKLYELYEIYGEDERVFGEYMNEEKENVLNKVKDIDMEALQKGIENIQKVLGIIQGFGIGNKENLNVEERPIYERFQD